MALSIAKRRVLGKLPYTLVELSSFICLHIHTPKVPSFGSASYLCLGECSYLGILDDDSDEYGGCPMSLFAADQSRISLLDIDQAKTITACMLSTANEDKAHLMIRDDHTMHIISIKDVRVTAVLVTAHAV